MDDKKVMPNKVITLSYQLEIEGKETPPWFSRPMRVSFLYGRDPLMPLIEQAITGAKEGDELTVTIPPEQAYGPYDKSLVQEISLDQLKNPDQVKEGEYYQEVTPTGRQLMFLVLEKKNGKVIADFNHPAAGHNVIMKIKIDEVREATAMDFAACDMRNCGSG
ncbi:FKBP-type peptidyl-prolyl cis-trans isomerase [Thermodesulfatator atlanticus]|uniref:FKBP-type peptidyl-prolyl cis-trans isomerase n=1 Tax=Thermodesulfatator atlanticus TaxID=501497 RepID=UPI0003B7964A|nr:FKBP-type peptidyl-prolyl cis-trans isomerase [Thermodesulfatator atlanticus]